VIDKNWDKKYLKVPYAKKAEGYDTHDLRHKITKSTPKKGIDIKPNIINGQDNQQDELKDILAISFDEFYYCFKGLKDIKYNESTGKLFMYAISKLNNKTNVAKVYINDYTKLRGFSLVADGYKQIKSDLLALGRLDGVLYSSRKLWFYSNIVIDTVIKDRFITIKFNEYFVNHIKDLYFWLPKELYRTKEKQAPHCWSLGYEIFKYIRTNSHAKNECFNRSVESLIKSCNLRHKINTNLVKRELYNPLITSLNYLNDIQDIVSIEIPSYQKDLLKVNVSIKVKDKDLLDTYNYKIQTLEKNKRNKQLNVKKAKELRSEGKTIKEIAVILNKTSRTINNYLR